jgi:hypothetical protein
MEPTPEAHVQRVKKPLQSSREILEDLSILDLQGTWPDLEQAAATP